MGENKSVLFTLGIDASKSIQTMAQLEKSLASVNEEIAEYQKKQKEGKTLTEEETAELIRLKETKKALQREYSEQSRSVQNEIVSEQLYKDTLKGLCAELSSAKDKLRAMKDAGSPEWQKQAAEVNELNEKIKDMEAQYGVHTRNVGNYAEGFISAFSQMGGSASKIINPLKNVTTGLKAMSATPVIAILGLLANVITTIISKLKSSEDNLNAVTKSMSAFGVITDGITALCQGLGKAIAWIADGLVGLLDKLGLVSDAMKQRQAIAEAEIELAKQQRETITENADAELKSAQLRAKATEKNKYTEKERLEFLKEAGKVESEIADRAYQDAKLEYEIIKAKNSLTDSSAEEKMKEAQAYAKMIQTQTAYFNKTRELNGQIIEAQKSVADKVYSHWEKTFTAISKLQKTMLNRRSDYLKDWSKTDEENSIAEFEWRQKAATEALVLEQKQQKAKLKEQLKYGKITASEYQQELRVLKAEMDGFLAKQANELFDFQKEQVKNAISLAGGEILEQKLDDIRAKFKVAEDAIKNDAQMSEEEKVFYLRSLYEEQERQIRQTRKDYNEKANSEIAEAVEELYRKDLRQFSSDEEEKLLLAVDKQKKLIESKKAAGQETLKEESELAQMEYNLRESTANKELSLAWKNANEQYRIRKEFLEKELEAETLTAQQRAELEKELAELAAEHNQQKIDSVSSYATQMTEILSSMNEVMGNLGDAQVQRAEAENDEKKSALDKRLKAGLISQKDYDKQVEKLDSDLDKKKAEIERKAAIRQKAMSAMQIAINTATAIMKIWADVPKVDFGVSTGILTALAAATGAAQLAAVVSAPLPQARKGGRIQGPTHEGGGVLVETEGDERIVSAKPSKVFPELLNLISYIGKNSSVPNTGFGTSLATLSGSQEARELDYDILSDKIASKLGDVIENIKIYAAITDIREADSNYTRIEESAKI